MAYGLGTRPDNVIQTRSGNCSRVYILPKILISGPNLFDLISGPNLKINIFLLHFWTFQAISRIFFFRGPNFFEKSTNKYVIFGVV